MFRYNNRNKYDGGFDCLIVTNGRQRLLGGIDNLRTCPYILSSYFSATTTNTALPLLLVEILREAEAVVGLQEGSGDGVIALGIHVNPPVVSGGGDVDYEYTAAWP